MKKNRISLGILLILVLTACTDINNQQDDLSENFEMSQSEEETKVEKTQEEDEVDQEFKNEETDNIEIENEKMIETPKVDTTPINGTSYTIKKGDTLTLVAKRADIPLHQLMSWNEIRDASLIFENQVLSLVEPIKETIPPEQQPTPPKVEEVLPPIQNNWQELAIEKILEFPGTWWNEYEWYEFEHAIADLYTIIHVQESGMDGSITRTEWGRVDARTLNVVSWN